MGERKKPSKKPLRPDEIIAAFDRERAQAQELNRRHTEHVRTTRTHDRPASTDRRRQS